MANPKKQTVFASLLGNSRFWILCSAVVASFLIAGFVQLLLPDGSLQNIRIAQIFGYTSFFLLYITLLASPFLKRYPQFVLKEQYKHARRAIGVTAFYFAFLHVFIDFFYQLGGFSGLKYLTLNFVVAFSFGVIALAIMAVLSLLSFDGVVRKIGFPRWKNIQRLVYIAGVFILIHILLIGPHFTNISVLGLISYACILYLLYLEALRIFSVLKAKKATS